MGETDLASHSVALTRDPAAEPSHAPVRLRLVEPRVMLGPISPELVLVDPELARAARAALPQTIGADPAGDSSGAYAPEESVRDEPLLRLAQAQSDDPRGSRIRWGSRMVDSRWAPFDTPDRRLRHFGMRLERRLKRGTERWRLVLPRGEVVNARGVAGSALPPAEVTGLLRAVMGSEALVPVQWHGDHADFARLQAYVVEQREMMVRHEPGARLGVDPENLHQFRVANRRLRAALRTGRKLLDPAWATTVKAELVRLSRVTGPLRDCDVLLEQLEHELERADSADLPAAGALTTTLRAQRDDLRRELCRLLDSAEYLGLLDRLEQPVKAASRPPKRQLAEVASGQLSMFVERVRTLGHRPSDSELHAVRIAVKRVRYAIELGGSPNRRKSAGIIDAARHLQDVLGAHQDTAVAESRLRALAEDAYDGSISFVAGALAERQRQRRHHVARELPAAWKHLRRATR
jgi:CHAD domain-containing protein